MEERVISFRDPSGSLLRQKGKVFRLIRKEFAKETITSLSTHTLKKFIEKKQFVKSQIIEKSERSKELSSFIEEHSFDPSLVLEHEAVFFPSYPYEWSAEMLYSAGMLNLELAENLLNENMGIKDATPYNVLFDGTRSVFVDLTSFENRNINDPIWKAYGQFIRMFILPLILNKYLSMPLNDIFISRLDGVDVEEAMKYLKGLNLLRPRAFLSVFLPYLFSKRSKEKTDNSLYKERTVKNADLARFILKSLYKRNKKLLTKIKPKDPSRSKWLNYMKEKSHYSQEIFILKEKFLSDILEEEKPKTVLDIGCNTGHFSFLAADKNAKVVAIDYDRSSIESLWIRAKRANKDILPLVVNICRPSPSVGWDNKECLSFIKRAEGKFEMVFMLAIIHHMIVTDRVPMAEIASLVSRITSKFLIIEFVSPEDQMFKVLVRGRDSLYKYITEENFIKDFEKYFEIKKKTRLNNSHRTMFLMSKKD